MTEGILGEDIEMGKGVFNDSQFLEKIKEICVNNHINTIGRDDLKEFIEKVKAILVNHPNEFVTIEEIANNDSIKEILENKWNLRSDPDYAVRWFICHPISFLSPYILCLECRDHADYAQWALRYSPDKEKEYQEREVRFDSIYSEGDRELNDINLRAKQLEQERYDLTIRRMEDFFPDIEYEEELRRRDMQLDKEEEMERRLRRTQLDENSGRRDL